MDKVVNKKQNLKLFLNDQKSSIDKKVLKNPRSKHLGQLRRTYNNRIDPLLFENIQLILQRIRKLHGFTQAPLELFLPLLLIDPILICRYPKPYLSPSSSSDYSHPKTNNSSYP